MCIRDSINIDPHEIDKGRFFSEEEDKSLTQVVVLGSVLAEKIFGEDNPIGQHIKLGRNNYTVIGTLTPKGGSIGFDPDDMAYVPVRTVQRKLLGINHVSFIIFQAADTSVSDYTATQVADIMRERHDITDPEKDDFAVITYEQGLDLLGAVTGAASVLLLLIASVSLVVGSVGIMNIMFVTVSERVPEIGLRKAIGATQNDIKWQFLVEAMFITSLGGILGIIWGTLLTFVISAAAQSQGFTWPAIFELHFFLIALGVSVGVGLLAGYIPARQAAKLDPIVALRK